MNVIEQGADEETGITWKVSNDEAGESPREWSNSWICFTNQSRSFEIDENLTPDQCELDCENCDGTGTDAETDETGTKLTDCAECDGAGIVFDPAKYLRENHDAFIVANIYKYEHGNVSFQAGHDGNPFTCPWDSGMIGFAIITEEVLNENFGGDEGKARKGLDGELETYTDWCNGAVYWYSIEDKDGAPLDSLGGMYGLDYAIKEAKESFDREVADERLEMNHKGPEKELKLELEEVINGMWCWTITSKGRIIDSATRSTFEDAVETGKHVYDQWKGN